MQRTERRCELSREAIARVREAEARAADIRAQATAKAQQMRTDNEKACAEKHDVRVKEMSAALRAGLDSMQEKADALVRQSRKEAQTDAEALKAAADVHMKEAVRVIVWEMFDSCQ